MLTEIPNLDQLSARALVAAVEQHDAERRARQNNFHQSFQATRESFLSASRLIRARAEAQLELDQIEEWLIDNFYVIARQLRDITDHLSNTYLSELPQLTTGELAGFPRVYALATDFVRHIDARLDGENLSRYVQSYQDVTNLTIGELWAIPIMLRVALAENLERLATRQLLTRAERDRANLWSSKFVVRARTRAADSVIAIAELAASDEQLTDAFVVQLSERLRAVDEPMSSAFVWIDERLAENGDTARDVVRREHYRQSIGQVSVGNSITSMRVIDALDWNTFFDDVSRVDRELRRDPAEVYGVMDLPSRDNYRHRLEKLARRGTASEIDVARLAIELAMRAVTGTREAHVGYYLIDAGSTDLERKVGYRAPLSERTINWVRRHALSQYILWILVITAVFIALPLSIGAGAEATFEQLVLIGLLTLLPASELAISAVNLVIARGIPPRTQPKLLLRDGIPDDARTTVVVPTLLTSAAGAKRLVEDMEVRYLANPDRNLQYGLLTDFGDAPTEAMPNDAELIEKAKAGIDELNEKHGQCFFLLHRHRKFNPDQDLPGPSHAGRGCWMGWDRKRGKLEEFNHLLRGATDTSYRLVAGNVASLLNIRYVITLDTDTQLPRESARRMVGTIVHPLNRPVLDPNRRRVIAGYGLIQPRVSTTLISGGRSLFARIFTGNTGLDPYTTAVSDVYQDLFGEGNYFGKGIYDVDAFQGALEGRIPPNRLLSHDLFEGMFVRVGLASDIELLDDHPSHYAVYTSRQHRWVRGDWQLAPWLLPRVPSFSRGKQARVSSVNDLPGSGRWKLFDNLRRSLLPPAQLVLLVAGWTVLPGSSLFWTVMALCTMAIPIFAHVTTALIRADAAVWTSHLRGFWGDVRVNALRSALAIVFVADQTVVVVDAIGRTLWRVCVTGRNLLEWETAAAAESRSHATFQTAAHLWRQLWAGSAVAVGSLILVAFVRPTALLIAMPVLVLWFIAPSVAAWISRSTPPRDRKLQKDDARFLRCTARKTWRFFETFVTAADHWLPPDNWQVDPRGVLARRTSPTNIGLYLLSCVVARDFSYLTIGELVERLEKSLATVQRLDRFHGHLYNWYDTSDLRRLPPQYISSVDSGNLVGHLLTLAGGCADIARSPIVGTALLDALATEIELLREESPNTIDETNALVGALALARQAPPESLTGWTELLGTFIIIAESLAIGSYWRQRLVSHLRVCHEEIIALTPVDDSSIGIPSLLDLLSRNTLAADLVERLQRIGTEARNFATDTDFTILYDQGMDLFTIGFNVATGKHDASNYDLLASESRLGSFVAIALGQVPQRHWFRLSRPLARIGGGRALLSWSGTMFEYLMPLLVMRSYWRTLLDETCTAHVARQIEYGGQRGVPWGISECAYNTLDLALNYQYRAFGVPGLGLKTGLEDDLVIAPYATLIALAITPREAVANLRSLQSEGMEGPYGFFESKDYTPSRTPPGARGVIVRTYMAHHQGMALVAIDNALNSNVMVRRFHADPRIRATELLLQERIPNAGSHIDTGTQEMPMPHEVQVSPTDVGPSERFGQLEAPVPQVMLLANDSYSLLVTASGAGYSKYKETMLTRWREDSTLDSSGAFIYLRNTKSDAVWSATYGPFRGQPSEYSASFTPEAVRFHRQDGDIETFAEITVSPEHAAEVRRVTLVNHGDKPATIEMTSYAEIALNGQNADLAHPAFGNLFVESSFDSGSGALLLTRRPRANDEERLWLGHLTVPDGPWDPLIEYETSRLQFLGRGRDAARPQALDPGARLSNSTGAVLDPCISLRRCITLAAGARASLSFVSVVGDTREAVMTLAQIFDDHRAIARAFELAWTAARVELRHLNISAQQAHRYMDLASSVVFNDRQRRGPVELIAGNHRTQNNLWPYGISGDRPIVLLRVDDAENTELISELLIAHEVWRINGLSTDLVIINDYQDQSGYLQQGQEALIRMVETSVAQGHLDQPGGVFVRRSEQFASEDRDLLFSVARVVLSTSKGRLTRQLVRPATPRLTERSGLRLVPTDIDPPGELEWLERAFFNGLGGFAPDGREYIIDVGPNESTPAPWVNVVANDNFGFIVTESGGGFTWHGNSQSNRLTPWSNDPIIDPIGEAIYLRDDANGRIWSPTPKPSPTGGRYRIRHGAGYTRFEQSEFGVKTDLTCFVPTSDTVKISRLVLTNQSNRRRQMSATIYAEWVLGSTRERAAAHVVTEYDAASDAVFARNRYSDPLSRIAFVAGLSQRTFEKSYTADRTEFLGRNGSHSDPAGLHRERLMSTTGAGYDPCGVIQISVELGPGEEHEIVFLLGEGRDYEDARDIIRKYAEPDAATTALNDTMHRWDKILGAIQVRTPDQAMNLIVNRWLLYQALVCRFWGRSGFYQSGGAYGFRDQLQDVMAFFVGAPALAREHILRAASRQFLEGDVQHWWLPDTGQGVRTRYTDDLLWLPYVTAAYVKATGDDRILDEPVPFLELRELEPHEHDLFTIAPRSLQSASLYEHCMRAIARGTTAGPRGLPLMGSGDWNDGMNRIGEKGKGESVWLGWFLARTLLDFAPLCAQHGENERADALIAQARALGETIDREAWDGEWYRRAYYDDGTPLGTAQAVECRIDAIAQSWSVIAGVGDPARARQAMKSLGEHLLLPEAKLLLLLTPPFDKTPNDPGYIKGYVPGVRENGGQYTHGAIWSVLATALLGDGDRAFELFSWINPVNRTGTKEDAARYCVEPYVIAADVYSAPQHMGRGGWTWYTGSAGWFHRLAVETLLGVKLQGTHFVVDPTIPREWPFFDVSIQLGETSYAIRVENPNHICHGVALIELDGARLTEMTIPLSDDGQTHSVRVVLGNIDPRSTLELTSRMQSKSVGGTIVHGEIGPEDPVKAGG